MSGADTTPYLTVPSDKSSGSAELSFGTTYNYFGLFWGSMDNYNSLSFYNGTNLVASYTGSDVANPNAANGNQSAPSTNSYVNFLDLPDFDKVRFTSTSYAFEVDNVAVGHVVPVPGSLLLSGIGLAGLSRIRRRRI